MRRLSLADYLLILATVSIMFLVAFRHQTELINKNTMLRRQPIADALPINEAPAKENPPMNQDVIQQTDEKEQEEKKLAEKQRQSLAQQQPKPPRPTASNAVELHEKYNIDYAKKSQKFLGGPQLVIYNRVPTSEVGAVEEVVMRLCETNGFAFHFSTIFSQLDLNETAQVNLARELTFVSDKAALLYDRHIYYTNFTQYGFPQPFYVNVIRDPLQRILSHYYTYSKQHNDDKTFDECVHLRGAACADGIASQMRFFCGQNPLCLYGEMDALALAKHNLVKHFSVVGVMEELDRFFLVLERVLPAYFSGSSAVYQSIKANYNLKNVIGYAETSQKMLVFILENEYEFYYYARQVFYDLQKRVENEK